MLSKSVHPSPQTGTGTEQQQQHRLSSTSNSGTTTTGRPGTILSPPSPITTPWTYENRHGIASQQSSRPNPKLSILQLDDPGSAGKANHVGVLLSSFEKKMISFLGQTTTAFFPTRHVTPRISNHTEVSVFRGLGSDYRHVSSQREDEGGEGQSGWVGSGEGYGFGG
jgi:hypothetical protein